jgi:hypothetical protein
MASSTKYTVLQILQIISDLRGESAVNSDAKRIRAVSDASFDFSNRKFWKTHLLADQSMAGDGTSNYTIGSSTYPMRLNGLSDIRVGGTDESYRYSVVDENTYKLKVSESSTAKVCYLWFDTANDLWKVHVNATPSASETIYYSYYWVSPVLTSTTSTLVCSNPKIIAKLALGDIYEGEDETEKSIMAKNEAEQLINELVGMDNQPAVNQLVSMGGSISRGIGTY